MNSAGDSFLLLAVVFGLVWLARSVCLNAAPGPARLVERLLSRLASSVGQVVWGVPMRRFGFIGVVWLALIGFAVLTSVATLAAIGSGNPIGAIGGLFLSVILWTLVVGAWYLARALARRRYTPRPLPTRQRER